MKPTGRREPLTLLFHTPGFKPQEEAAPLGYDLERVVAYCEGYADAIYLSGGKTWIEIQDAAGRTIDRIGRDA